MSKIGKAEWIILYIISGFVDIVQIIISFTGIGIVVSEIGDKIFGVLLFTYFQIRGVSLIKHPTRLLSLLGVAGLETISGGIAPAWIVDIWYIHSTVKHEERAYRDQQKNNSQFIDLTNKPLNQNGFRNAESNKQEDGSTPLNQDGIRRPRSN